MRIAYIAPYQGPGILQLRPAPKNIGLAANVKIELIADLLKANGHDVEIFSQGEIAERRFKVYPAFHEPIPFQTGIIVQYASALPLKFINGAWSSLQSLSLFKRRHRVLPFDIVIIYNLKLPQMICGWYAIRKLRLPVILQYEDDALVDIRGKSEKGWKASIHFRLARTVLNTVTGGIGVSPYLLSQFPSSTPKLLLRGVVGSDLATATLRAPVPRKNWAIYSGTHTRNKGLEQLIRAWRMAELSGWQLHITGRGEITSNLEQLAQGDNSIVFHGLLSRANYIDFLGQAKIGINPHDLSESPGNVFAFKIVEYLAAGLHVVSTPMGILEPEIEAGMTYLKDNSSETIRTTLTRIVSEGRYKKTASLAAHNSYGPHAVAEAVGALLTQVCLGDSTQGPAVRS